MDEEAAALGINHVRTLSELSGGERSFVTVAFLLALWQVVETPFHAADEFDVFMDAGNRQKSITALLEVATATPHQYIFISPQAQGSVNYITCTRASYYLISPVYSVNSHASTANTSISLLFPIQNDHWKMVRIMTNNES